MAFLSTGSSWRVHGDDAQGIDLLGNQVLDNRDLLRRIGLGRTDQGRLDAGRVGEFLDADFHTVEPVDAGNLDDSDKGHVFRGLGVSSRGGFGRGGFGRGGFSCIGGRGCSRRSGRGCTGADHAGDQHDHRKYINHLLHLGISWLLV